MKAINIKLATFSFAAMLLASCSDSNNILENGGTTPIKTVVGSAVTSTTDAQELASRITNYKVTTETSKARTRAYTGSDWDGVTIPENAAKIEKDEYNAVINVTNNNNIILIPAGVTIKTLFNMEGKTVYVAGTLDYENCTWWGKGEIRVLKGGKFIGFKNQGNAGIEFLGQNKIINYGTIAAPQNATDLTIASQIVDNHGSLDLSGKNIHLSNNAILNVTGTLKAKTLSITNSEVYSGCSANISDFVYISNDSKLHVSYLHCKNFKQDSSGKVVVKDQSMIECDNMFMNLNSQQDTYALSETDAVCVIKAAKLAFNAPGPDANNKISCDMFATSGERAGFIVDVPEDKIYGVKEDKENTLGALSDGKHGQKMRPRDSSITEEGYGVTLNNHGNVFLSSSDEALNMSSRKLRVKIARLQDSMTTRLNQISQRQT